MNLLEIRELNKTITEDDIPQIRETLQTIITAGIIAHNEGLLGLEEYANKSVQALLQKGINLVIDGADPELVREILENKYYANGSEGVDALCDVLIIEGMLKIQMGSHPTVLEQVLRSMLSDRIDSKLEESIYQLEKIKYNAANTKSGVAGMTDGKKQLGKGSGILTAEEVKELLQTLSRRTDE